MSKFWKVLLAATCSFIILWSVALMFPRFIAWCYKLTPQGSLCDSYPYLFNWATNGIYVAILIVAVLAGVVAYLQLASIRSQQETEIIFTVYHYLDDEKFKLGKKKVYEYEKMLSDKTKITKCIDEIDTLLLLYNNIALLILNNKVNQSSLPTMFYANAVKMSDLCRYYIEFRQERDHQFGKYYAQHFLRFIPVAKKNFETAK